MSEAEDSIEATYAGILEEHHYALQGISLTLLELLGRVAQLEAERGAPKDQS